MRGRRPSLLLGAILVLLAGCRENRLPEADGTRRRLTAGRTIFERKCASCHNLNGDGNTITASRFKYANLIDEEWRSDGSRRAIEEQIRKGHDPMPRFEGKLTDEEIRETAAWVLEIRRQAHGGK